jgi:hypothetical protein
VAGSFRPCVRTSFAVGNVMGEILFSPINYQIVLGGTGASRSGFLSVSPDIRRLSEARFFAG